MFRGPLSTATAASALADGGVAVCDTVAVVLGRLDWRVGSSLSGPQIITRWAWSCRWLETLDLSGRRRLGGVERRRNCGQVLMREWPGYCEAAGASRALWGDACPCGVRGIVAAPLRVAPVASPVASEGNAEARDVNARGETVETTSASGEALHQSVKFPF
jgi:hypothetical protein